MKKQITRVTVFLLVVAMTLAAGEVDEVYAYINLTVKMYAKTVDTGIRVPSVLSGTYSIMHLFVSDDPPVYTVTNANFLGQFNYYLNSNSSNIAVSPSWRVPAPQVFNYDNVRYQTAILDNFNGSTSSYGNSGSVVNPTLEYDISAYPTVTLNLEVAELDGTPYNGSVMVSSEIGSQIIQIVDGRGSVWVYRDGIATVTQSTPFNNKNEHIFKTIQPSEFSAPVNITAMKTANTFTITAKDYVTGTGILGFEYTTTDPWGNTVTATTDNNGKAVFTLPYNGSGKYTFTETKIPKGYKKSGQGFEMTCSGTGNGGSASKDLSYQYYPDLDVSTLALYLADRDTGAPIAGARFEIAQKVLVTDTSGIARISSIDNGTYSLVQKSSALHYEFSSTPQSITINSEDKFVELINAKKKGSLKVKISSPDGTPIPTAKFIITGSGSSKAVTSDSFGYLPLSNLSYGIYTLMEQEIPAGYQPKNQNINLSLDDNTNGSETILTYQKAQDRTPPTMTFTTEPPANSVDVFEQILTLSDDSSGIKELKIDGEVVKENITPGVLSDTYTHVVTANKTYQYILTDHAGNAYTTTRTYSCLKNSSISISNLMLSNYKTTANYNGKTANIINGSYSQSNILFSLSDPDATDTWSYKLEVIDESGAALSQSTKQLTSLGNISDRVLFNSLNDGIYRIVVTANDKYTSASGELLLIIKRTAPPKPEISFDKSGNTVSINYPVDWLDTYSQKQYTYSGTTQSYTGDFTAATKGLLTATYTDLAGNKSTTSLSLTPSSGSTGPTPIPIPTPIPGGGSETGGGSGSGGSSGVGKFKVEETRNSYIYYINTRVNGSDYGITQAILQRVEE